MKINFGVTVALALATAVSFASAGHAAVCGTGPLIEYDTNTFAYAIDPVSGLNAYDEVNFSYAPNSALTVVGHVTNICPPLPGMVPGFEYTVVFGNLYTPAGGTSVIPSGGNTIYRTTFGSGNFWVYKDNGTAAPVEATPMPANPPNATVPSTFTDGELILTGTLSNFRATVTKTNATGQVTHVMTATYQFTGGTQYGFVNGSSPSTITSTWCPKGPGGNGSCPLQPGYSAQPNGKFDTPSVTASLKASWGSVKILYH